MRSSQVLSVFIIVTLLALSVIAHPHGDRDGRRHGDDDEGHGHGRWHGRGDRHGKKGCDDPVMGFYRAHVQCRQCFAGPSPNSPQTHRWCAAPSATSDREGVCLPSDQSCPDGHTALASADSCTNDAPESKVSCSLCTLDGYAWCQDGEWDDEYAGHCMKEAPVFADNEDGEEEGSSDSDASSDDSSDEEDDEESSDDSSSSSSDDDAAPAPPADVTTTTPSTKQCKPQGVITSFRDCSSVPIMRAQWMERRWKHHRGHRIAMWIGIPLVLLCTLCCCKKRCKKRCKERRERCQQRRERCHQRRCQMQQAPSAVAVIPSVATTITEGLPVATAVPLTPTNSAPLLYSHNPMPPLYHPPATAPTTTTTTITTSSSAPVEIEMRPVSGTEYPGVASNGYARLDQDAV